MLLKHASNVPQCALMIEELFREAGFPEGVFQTLLIGSDKVEKILTDPRVAARNAYGQRGRRRASGAWRGETSEESAVWNWAAAIHLS